MQNLCFTRFALLALLYAASLPAMADFRQINRSVTTTVDLNIIDSLDASKKCLKSGSDILLTATDDAFYKFRVVDKDDIGCSTADKIEKTRLYTVSVADLNTSSPSYKELAAGALVVPFKYYYGGDGSFTGNSSVGGYLGVRYNNAFWGFTVTPIVFVGASTIAVPKEGAESQNLSGFSSGVGLIGSAVSGFQAGFVIGYDRVSRNAGWINNGKPWLAIEIGYDFAK